MKVILYMAISANGLIAKENDETPWSDEEWEAFNQKAKEIGAILIGRRTWELMQEDGSLSQLPSSLILVLTSQTDLVSKDPRIVFVNSFEKALGVAKFKGYDTLMVAGGAQTNTTALRSGKITEIFLDIEPFLLGKGIPLFHPLNQDFNLKLLGINKIGPNTVQLHYKVL